MGSGVPSVTDRLSRRAGSLTSARSSWSTVVVIRFRAISSCATKWSIGCRLERIYVQRLSASSIISAVGAYLCLRIPSWVEVTEGEVPATLSYHAPTEQLRHPHADKSPRQPLGRNIITSLWGNCTIKVLVGFLFLYPAFVAKSHDATGWEQLAILGLIGAAAAIGNLAGNFTAARLKLGSRELAEQAFASTAGDTFHQKQVGPSPAAAVVAGSL